MTFVKDAAAPVSNGQCLVKLSLFHSVISNFLLSVGIFSMVILITILLKNLTIKKELDTRIAMIITDFRMPESCDYDSHKKRL